jgi:hypothetical protein
LYSVKQTIERATSYKLATQVIPWSFFIGNPELILFDAKYKGQKRGSGGVC